MSARAARDVRVTSRESPASIIRKSPLKDRCVSEAEINLMAWSSQIPLCDDLWLEMQARNLGVVEFSILRQMEDTCIGDFYENDRVSMEYAMPLSALSQMWIFSLYEFFRTWRQRAKEIIDTNKKILDAKTNDDEDVIASIIKESQEKEKYIRTGVSWYSLHISKSDDVSFVSEVQDYMRKTEDLFRSVEALRVTIAKHEVPKTNKFVAEAPGYGRVNLATGSIYWFVTLKDDTKINVDRREVANEFFMISDDQEE